MYLVMLLWMLDMLNKIQYLLLLWYLWKINCSLLFSVSYLSDAVLGVGDTLVEKSSKW